ncbi:MAG: M60 family metallopeptidase [Phycisphaerales bacterium]
MLQFAVVALCSSALAQAPVADFLKDVHTVAGPGSPGVVLSLRETITPVVLGGLDKGTVGPVIVAGTWGKGRVVAFGHSGYLDKENLKGDTDVLMDRLVKWATTESVDPPPGTKLKATVIGTNMVPWFSSRGFGIAHTAGAGKGNGLLTDDNLTISNAKVLVLGETDLTDEQIATISAYVKAGGGLVVAQTGWGWQQIKGGPDMRTNSLNKLLLDAGIAWTDEIIDKTDKGGFDTSKTASGPVTLDTALEVLLESDSEKPDAEKQAEKARQSRLAQAAAIVSRGVRILPESDTTTRPRLAALMSEHEKDLAPTEKAPLDGKKPLLRTLMAMQIDAINSLSPEKVQAHPAAAAFPGAVPSDAKRVTKAVQIDSRVPRWHSTGLYAPAGEVVTVTIPSTAKGLSVRIGCHTDHLWHLPSWKRVPQIAIDRPLNAGENKVASAFGGLLYIEVDKPNQETVDVTIAGCVEAPLFVLGKTSVDEWQKTIRNAPGPWAELATPSVIISVPSSALRELDDPTEICTTWQAVLDNASDLGSIPRERKSPERYVPDVQISAGYMHSGYPIMTHLDAVPPMSQAALLKAGNWGLFHELGHNHQKGEWTFEGTGEVTNNLWSLYLMETIAHKTPGQGHDAMDSAEKRHEKALKHIETGANFDKWKSDPFLALEMYYELREAFGWEPFKKVFAEYQTLKPDERPKTEMDKHDQWMVRMSRQVGKNLGPFFEKWGVPTSEKARQSIKDLPVWKPDWW